MAQKKNAAGSRVGRGGIGGQLLAMIGIGIAGAALIRVAGGFPPQPWIFLVQMVPHLPLLWKAKGMAIVFPLGMVVLVALSLLLAWLLLLYFFVRVARNLLAGRRATQVLATAGQWDAGAWQDSDHDEKTQAIAGTVNGGAWVSNSRLVRPGAGEQGKRITDPLISTRGSEAPILGARERYYARFSEPETQPMGVLAAAYERPEGVGESQQSKAMGQETTTATATVRPGSEQRWWMQEEGDEKERDRQWWMQEEQDELPTTEPGQDEESDAPFIVELKEHETLPERDPVLLTREGDNGVGAAGDGREQRELQVDARPVAFVFGVGLDVGITHRGAPNEDSVFATTSVRITKGEPQPTGLFIVADGLGGHERGYEASQLAVSQFSDAVLPVIVHGTGDEQRDEREVIEEGVRRANTALYRRNCEQATSMGTTLTAAFLVGRKASIANVGDSRTYLYRPDEGLRQVTRDHSLVMRMVEVGAITHEEIYVHPLRNQVYRSLGNAAEVEVETTAIDVREGDLLLLCSDGLWEMVRDDEIEAIIGREGGPSAVSGRLVQAALKNGGADNIGVVVVGVVAADG